MPLWKKKKGCRFKWPQGKKTTRQVFHILNGWLKVKVMLAYFSLLRKTFSFNMIWDQAQSLERTESLIKIHQQMHWQVRRGKGILPSSRGMSLGLECQGQGWDWQPRSSVFTPMHVAGAINRRSWKPLYSRTATTWSPSQKRGGTTRMTGMLS